MAMLDAVSYVRGAIKDYKVNLPNTHRMDYDTTNVKEGTTILRSEGRIFIKWLSNIVNSKGLENIVFKLNTCVFIESITNKNEDNVSIRDISMLLKDMKKLIALNIDGVEDLLSNSGIENAVNTIMGVGDAKEDRQFKSIINGYKNTAATPAKAKNLEQEFNLVHTEFANIKHKILLLVEVEKQKFSEQTKKAIISTIKILSQYIHQWYNFDLDFEQLLKAGGEQQNYFDQDSKDENAVLTKIVQALKDHNIIKDEDNISKVFNDAAKVVVNGQNIRDIGRRSSSEHEDSEEESSFKRQRIDDHSDQQISGGGSRILENIKLATKQVANILMDNNVSLGNFGTVFDEAGKKYVALKGTGDFGEEKPIDYIHPSFGQYALYALEHILHLRISDLQLENIEIIQGIFIDQTHNNIHNLLSQILNSPKSKILVPLNLVNEHAVGLIFEKDQSNNVISIKCLDSLNKETPQELKQLITNKLGLQVQCDQITVEQQKYANCGAEVVENFILYLTGKRVSQEKAIELHSKLVENTLLNIKPSGIHLLFEELNNSHYSLTDYLDQANHNNDQFYNFDYDKLQRVEVTGDIISLH